MNFIRHYLPFCLLVELVTCSSLENCFRMDSISCVQLQLYRTAKFYFDATDIEIVDGLFVHKTSEKRSKSFDETVAEARIISQDRVVERQAALEEYFTIGIKHLWNDGTVSWNPLRFARSLIDAIPLGVKTEITNFVGVEGRGKEKKQMKMLLPLLIGIKLKLAALGALAYMGIAIIAKKAVLAGIISLLVSGFIAIKNLIETHRKHGDMTPYHNGVDAMGGWPTPGAAAVGYYDHELAASQFSAQHQQQAAYGDVSKKTSS